MRQWCTDAVCSTILASCFNMATDSPWHVKIERQTLRTKSASQPHRIAGGNCSSKSFEGPRPATIITTTVQWKVKLIFIITKLNWRVYSDLSPEICYTNAWDAYRAKEPYLAYSNQTSYQTSIRFLTKADALRIQHLWELELSRKLATFNA